MCNRVKSTNLKNYNILLPKGYDVIKKPCTNPTNPTTNKERNKTNRNCTMTESATMDYLT